MADTVRGCCQATSILAHALPTLVEVNARQYECRITAKDEGSTPIRWHSRISRESTASLQSGRFSFRRTPETAQGKYLPSDAGSVRMMSL